MSLVLMSLIGKIKDACFILEDALETEIYKVSL